MTIVAMHKTENRIAKLKWSGLLWAKHKRGCWMGWIREARKGSCVRVSRRGAPSHLVRVAPCGAGPFAERCARRIKVSE